MNETNTTFVSKLRIGMRNVPISVSAKHFSLSLWATTDENRMQLYTFSFHDCFCFVTQTPLKSCFEQLYIPMITIDVVVRKISQNEVNIQEEEFQPQGTSGESLC